MANQKIYGETINCDRINKFIAFFEKYTPAVEFTVVNFIAFVRPTPDKIFR